jgi:hypothetical protein
MWHIGFKGENSYWPRPEVISQRKERADPAFSHRGDNLYYITSAEERRELAGHGNWSWKACNIGSCLIHISDKIRCGYIDNPYNKEYYEKGEEEEEFIIYNFTAMMMKDWHRAFRIAEAWGDTPAQYCIIDKSPQLENCSNDDWRYCKNLGCIAHHQIKKSMGYWPSELTLKDQEKGWNMEFKNNPSNLYHEPNFELLKKLEESAKHHETHWTNCIAGFCQYHRDEKNEYQYVPTYEKMLEINKTPTEGWTIPIVDFNDIFGIPEEGLKGQTPQPKGC